MMTQSSVKLKIEGMTCDHCVKAVLAALRGAPEVRVIAVRVGEADIVTSSPAGAQIAARAIAAAGYRAEVATTDAVDSRGDGCGTGCSCRSK